MNSRRFLVGSLAAGAALAAIRYLFATRAAAKPAVHSTGYEAIDAYVERERRRLRMPGVSLAIVEGDRITHVRGFGRARPDGEAPAPQTPFMIGSLTKSFTALAVMQLVEAGKIEPDAPVQRYLPWFRVADPRASAAMTVRHLLNQTSGLPGWSGETLLADSDDSSGAAERRARDLSSVVLTRAPGSEFEYSNANYLLLGLILETVSGQSYADYVQEHILTPLEMSRTTASPDVARQNGLATGHRYWFAHPFAVRTIPVPPGALPGGGLISTAEDLARYMIAHLNGGCCGSAQILSGAGIDELHRGVTDINVMGLKLGQYGMGWMIDQIAGTSDVWLSGTLPDFAAHMALLPEQEKGVVLLFNACHHWMNPVLAEVGLGATGLLAGDRPRPGPVPLVRQYPRALRGLLLIPALQIAGVAAALRLLRRWRLDPRLRPNGGRAWALHVLLPLIPDLITALSLVPMLGKRRGYLLLYKPDSSWIVLVCGSLELVWSVLRTGLVLGEMSKPRTI